MIAKLQKFRAISKNTAILSLILSSTISLIGCNSNASENSISQKDVTSEIHSSTEPNIVEDKAQQAANSAEKQTKTAKVNPVKLTSSQIVQVKQALTGKNLIAEHAFQVNLENFGNTLFVPAEESSEDSPQPKLGLYLIKDNQIEFTFPLPEDVQSWNFMELDAVSFEKNSQNDGTEILLISKYWAGPGGPGSSEPFPVAMFYNQSNDSFQLNKKVTQKLIDEQVKTIAEARKFLN